MSSSSKNVIGPDRESIPGAPRAATDCVVNGGGRLRRAVKRSLWLASAYYCLDDYMTGRRYRRGHIETTSGMAHAGLDPEGSIDYIDEVFDDYKCYAGVAAFHGRVAEIGPGDNCGVALRFLGDGCASVDLVDRFYSKRDTRQHEAIYRALLRRHPEIASRLGPMPVFDEERFAGVLRHYGPDAAAEVFFRSDVGYDFIVSRAVLEHVYDPVGAVQCMARAVNRGGMLLHKVDLRDHDMFSRYGHELRFLEVPEWLYGCMTRHSGRPNRVLVNGYRAALEGSGLQFRILVTRLAGVGDVVPHLAYEDISEDLKRQSLDYVRSVRGRFAGSLRGLSDADLAIAGIFIVARNAGP